MSTFLLAVVALSSLALGFAIEWTRHHHASPAAVAIAALFVLLAADQLYRRWVSAALHGQDLGRHAGPRKVKALATAEQPAIAPTAGDAPDSSYHDSIEEAAEAFAEHLGLFLDEALGDEFGDDPIAAVIGNDWNDCTATSADQVITELRACAANLRTAVTT